MNKGQKELSENMSIHQYYMDIINCMPTIVYWVDTHCMLAGCNIKFMNMLGVTDIRDFSGTPYDQMSQQLPWTEKQIESFKLSDMAVLFSGVATYNTEELPVLNHVGNTIYYLATRVPLFDADKKVTGLVVILNDITEQKNREKLFNHTHPTGRTGIKHTDKALRVLLVEDNIVAQHVQQALLMSLNCDVDIAGSGEVGLRLFEPGKYAIVFMDIGLQDTSGYIVSKKIREMEKNTSHHVPIIALTVYQADVVKDDCNDYFMNAVITKPLTNEKALLVISQYVYNKIDVEWEAVV